MDKRRRSTYDEWENCFLDAIKALAILGVVFCHYVALPSESIVGNGLMSLSWCAVPCFFMVTGSLLHNKKELSIKKHIKKIPLTYFTICCWKLLYLLFYGIITEVHFSKAGLFNYIFLFGNINNVNIGHMWFMYAYILVLFFLPISYYIMASDDKLIQIYTGAILFFGGIGIPVLQFLCTTLSTVLGVNFINIKALSSVLPFGGYINMLFYFFSGGFIFKYRREIETYLKKRDANKYILLIMVFVGILGNMITKFTYTKSFQWQGIYLVDGYNRFSTLLMAFGVFLLFLILGDGKMNKIVAKYIGEETVGIYYLHMPILSILSLHIYPYLHAYYSVGLNIVKSVLVIVLCVVITKVVKKIPYLNLLVR